MNLKEALSKSKTNQPRAFFEDNNKTIIVNENGKGLIFMKFTNETYNFDDDISKYNWQPV